MVYLPLKFLLYNFLKIKETPTQLFFVSYKGEGQLVSEIFKIQISI